MTEFRAQPVYGRSVESLVSWQGEIVERARRDRRREGKPLHGGPWRGWRPDALSKASPMSTSARAAEVRVSQATGKDGDPPLNDAQLDGIDLMLQQWEIRVPDSPQSSTPGAPEPPDTDPSEAPDPA